MPPSINIENKPVETLPESVTHVYAKKYDVKGLGSKWIGPFAVLSRPSRSQIEIKVGLNANGAVRKELRHISDLKVAYLRDGARQASRPKRGRPLKPSAPDPPSPAPSSSSKQKQTNTHTYNLRQRIPTLAEIDFSVPPPILAPNSKIYSSHADQARTWSASESDLIKLNQSIAGGPVRCEARG